ncbi:uncharacterized protein LOC123561650 isoform X2 [Mercenaria mercenaria]|uniref:uncharacterized protein LOC123561650 isoform X2 n=1 Tax=Mercenaria mercenaria TaxID=6596 RepID=UPI00234EDD0C|nr:uncharacterized protein LOC123561650 isoform X2 [Mercenaria mercenaria]
MKITVNIAGYGIDSDDESETSEESMRKDNTWNVSVNTDRPMLEDDAHLKVSYSPGKKGGNFGLPLGAKLIVPDGIFNKKDNITCEVAPPTQRWKYTPVLPLHEHLTSEIFLFSSSVSILKKAVVIQIPYYPIDPEHSEINVKGKWKDENEWVDVGFLRKDGGKSPCVELEVDRLGMFVVTFTPKKELFDVTVQGCLYNSRLSKYISIRFPKKTTDKNFQCTIQINPIAPEKVQLAKQNFPHETNELVETSEFIDILPEYPVTFKRAVSVKLPLPAGFEESEEKKTDDIAVLQKTPNGWAMVEGAYKFTRTTVTFDVKTLSTFCVALSKPSRKTALHRSITVLEGRVSKEMGEILVFINIQEKLWVVVLECCPINRKEEKVAERKGKGYQLIDKSQIQKEEEKKPAFSSRRPPPPMQKQKAPEVNGFEIYDGMKWGIEVTDDIKVSFESDYLDNKELQFFKFLPESYRRFVIEPKTNEEKGLIGNISFVPVDSTDQLAKFASTIKFKVEISEDNVRAYFKPEFVPEEPKPEKETPKIEFDLNIKGEEKKDEPSVPRFKPIPSTVMERLMRTSRKPIVLEKESRILSGKSLMTLSRLVPEGLTLAVHLDLPDSTITGLGFDAISNGLGMVDVTYKILLYWKRQMKDKKDGAVNVLSMALRDMGRDDIAEVVNERHKENKDLTLDCFIRS